MVSFSPKKLLGRREGCVPKGQQAAVCRGVCRLGVVSYSKTSFLAHLRLSHSWLSSHIPHLPASPGPLCAPPQLVSNGRGSSGS